MPKFLEIQVQDTIHTFVAFKANKVSHRTCCINGAAVDGPYQTYEVITTAVAADMYAGLTSAEGAHLKSVDFMTLALTVLYNYLDPLREGKFIEGAALCDIEAEWKVIAEHIQTTPGGEDFLARI
jgi:hypothetical protein